MRWCLSTQGSPEYVLPVAQSTAVTPVSPYTHCRWLVMYLEAVIERVEKRTWRPRLSELWDALGGQIRVNSEMHLETEIEWTQRCTGRLRLSEFGDALAGYDRARWEEYLKAVRFGGRRDGSWDSIRWLTCNCENVESWVQQYPPRVGELAGSGTLSILGWCCIWCMLY